MKRSEFIPGVLFHLPGSTFYVYIHRILGLNVQGIEEWGYLNKEGTLTLVENREKKFFHLEFKPKGFQLWQVTASVYLYSKTIPFEALTKVEIPSPAPVTNQVQYEKSN